MLRSNLLPHAADAKPEDNQHAFILVGDKTLFLCHMTMFHMEEHCHQLILKVSVPDPLHRQIQQWRKERPKNRCSWPRPRASTSPTWSSEPPGTCRWRCTAASPRRMKTAIYHHWPWDGLEPAVPEVPVTLARVVLHRHFHLGFPPPQSLTYFLFGAGDEAHMQSYQFAEPDCDHVLSLSAAPDWLRPTSSRRGPSSAFPHSIASRCRWPTACCQARTRRITTASAATSATPSRRPFHCGRPHVVVEPVAPEPRHARTRGGRPASPPPHHHGAAHGA
jgi:hypothetical protein